jgi:hypothetical protein
LVAWFQDAPKETHVQEVKIIFRYIKVTLDFGSWYSRDDDFTLTPYTYVNERTFSIDVKGGELQTEGKLQTQG